MGLGNQVTNICTTNFLDNGKGLRFMNSGPWFYLQGDSPMAKPVIIMGV